MSGRKTLFRKIGEYGLIEQKFPLIEKSKNIAYHEAGHSLCYFLDEKEINYVTINKVNESLGNTEGIRGMGSYFNPEFHDDNYDTLYKDHDQPPFFGPLQELV